MKKYISIALVIGFLFLFLGMSADVGFAQTEGGDGTSDPNTFTLAQLGIEQRFMHGPYDALDVYFSVPDYWQLNPNTYITLTFDYTLGGAGVSSVTNEQNWIGGSLIVRMNDDIVMTALLTGFDQQTITVPIPAEALVPKGQDARHHIRFYLDASENCNIQDLQTTLWIDPNSTVTFAYSEVLPQIDLTEFPRPYYQPDSIVPAEAFVVVPDNPTAAELEAGYSVIAGLGSSSSGESLVSLRVYGDMTQDTLESQNIIFVGNRFPDLEGVEFPVTYSGGQFNLASNQAGDGVIQSIISPWSSKNVIMFVGGNSDEALLKAAKAISTGKLISSGLPNVALVDNVNPETYLDEPVIDQTLRGLGFKTTGIGVYGDVYYDMTFYATAEQAVSEGAYFDFISTRSDLLDFDRSGLMILVNDEIVGTVGYTGAEQTVTTDRIEILPNYLRRGENRLEIVSSLVPSDLCYDTNFQAAWVTVSDLSTIHLPISDNTSNIGKRYDLANYPTFFFSDQQLSDLAIILPSSNVEALQGASDLAYYLGSQATISMANFEVYYADSVPQEVLNNKDLLFVGKATDFPQIPDLNDTLPAPFPEDSDIPDEPAMPVNFDVMEGVPKGYIQLVESPWNSDHVVVMVMGNLDEGITLAKSALSQDLLVNDLNGNYAEIFDGQVVSTETRFISSTVSGPVDAGGQQTTGNDNTAAGGNGGTSDTGTGQQGQGDTVNPSDVVTRPAWLQPTIIGVTALTVIVFIVLVVRYRIFNISGKND